MTPPFVKTGEKISPSVLYEQFRSTDAYGLVSVQFLGTLNIFIRGDKILSKNEMSEFFHNLSMQALSEDDNSVRISFNHIRELCDNLKELLRSNKALTSDKMPHAFVEYLLQEFKQIKDGNQ